MALKTRISQLKLHKLFVGFSFVIICLLLLTIALSNTASQYYQLDEATTFTEDTTVITNSVSNAIQGYMNTLYSGRAFILGSQEVTVPEWVSFYRSQDIFTRFPGMSTISYVEVVSKANKQAFVAKKRSQPEFGPSYTIEPAGDRPEYALGSLLISNNPIKTSGFDVYSTPDRRAVYAAAEQSGEPTSSPQLKLRTGYNGMFIVLPVFKDNHLQGFVNVSIRTKDFLAAVFKSQTNPKIAVTATDITDSQNSKSVFTIGTIHKTGKQITQSDTISLGGRQWRIDYAGPQDYSQNITHSLVPNLILGTGFLLICILSILFYSFVHMPKKYLHNS